MEEPPADNAFEMQVRAAPLPADILIIEGFASPERETADMPLIGEHTEQTVDGGRTDRRRAGEFPRELPRRELLCGVRREVPDERLFLFRLVRHSVSLPAPPAPAISVSPGSFPGVRFSVSVSSRLFAPPSAEKAASDPHANLRIILNFTPL